MASLPASRKTILIIDDNEAARTFLRIALEAAQFEVDIAPNAAEALACLRAGTRPDIVLLDLIMPHMTGLDFLAERKHDPVVATIPVVVCSAAEDLRGEAIALGATDFVQKPLHPSELATRLLSVVNRHIV